MSELYDRDIVLWSEHQADLLRRHAAGERLNDADLDWPNIIGEIESVGNEQRNAMESLLAQALTHALKIRAWPAARDADHWRGEARRFRDDAMARFVPSMRQRIDLSAIYRRALRAMPPRIDGQPPLLVPVTCPDTLDQLLSDAPCAMFPEENYP